MSGLVPPPNCSETLIPMYLWEGQDVPSEGGLDPPRGWRGHSSVRNVPPSKCRTLPPTNETQNSFVMENRNP